MTIQQKQCLLYYLGYYQGKIDGKWGSKSEKAVKMFQKDYGLTSDGIVGEKTVKALKEVITYGMPAKKDWWDDIQYFKKSEFACKCGKKYCTGYPAEMNEQLVRVADRVRKHFGKKVTVSSGLRCAKHNASVGGVTNSKHKVGKAMDFSVKGKSSDEVLSYIKKQPEIRYTYAIDSKYVHMDVK